MNARDLTPQQRKQLGIKLVAGRARVKLAEPVSGWVQMLLPGAPPTTTHHDKKLRPIGNWKAGRGGKGGGRMTLADSAELVAARRWYEMRIAERAVLVPIAPPIIAFVVFYYPMIEGVEEGDFCVRKPDRENAVKTLFDVLAQRGWVEDDSQISAGPIEKRHSRNPRVEIVLRTLTGKSDVCNLPIQYRSEQFVLHPLAIVGYEAGRPASLIHTGTKGAGTV